MPQDKERDLIEFDRVGVLRLTPRQNEVLKLAAKGNSNKKIARELGISLPTVKNHFSGRQEYGYGHGGGIFERLNVQSRTGAVMEAIRLGILNLEEI